MGLPSFVSGVSTFIGGAIRAAIPVVDAAQLAATCYGSKKTLPPIFKNVTSSVTATTQARYNALLEKLHFKKNPELLFGRVPGVAFAYGCSLFPFAQPIILLDRKSEEIDPEVMWMFTKHELSHLRNNDLLCKKTVQLVSNIALAYFFPSFPISSVMVYFGQFAVTSFIEKTMGRTAEESADVFACQDATEDELKAFLRGLEAMRRAETEHFQTLEQNPTSFETNRERGYRISLQPHSAIERRIQQVEHALNRLNPEIDVAKVKEDHRVAKLATWWTFLRTHPKPSEENEQAAKQED